MELPDQRRVPQVPAGQVRQDWLRVQGGRQLLAVGLEAGAVEVLHLKTEYRAEDEESCDRELERFLHYVSII